MATKDQKTGAPRQRPKRKHKTPRVTEQDQVAMAEMYVDQGLSIRAIAAQTGYAYGTVHRALTMREVPRRPRSSGNQRRRSAQ